jgi:hypothetical protein
MRVDEARRARDQARAQRRWLAWLRSALAIRRERRTASGPAVAAGRVSDEEEKIQQPDGPHRHLGGLYHPPAERPAFPEMEP